MQAPPKEVAGELAKLERVARAKQRKMEERMCHTFDDYLRLAIARGYPKAQGWAAKRMSLRSSYRRA